MHVSCKVHNYQYFSHVGIDYRIQLHYLRDLLGRVLGCPKVSHKVPAVQSELRDIVFNIVETKQNDR